LDKRCQATKSTQKDPKKLTKHLTINFFFRTLFKQKDKKFHKVENNLPINLNPFLENDLLAK